MSTAENNVVIKVKDSSGNAHPFYPKTKMENVDGLSDALSGRLPRLILTRSLMYRVFRLLWMAKLHPLTVLMSASALPLLPLPVLHPLVLPRLFLAVTMYTLSRLPFLVMLEVLLS